VHVCLRSLVKKKSALGDDRMLKLQKIGLVFRKSTGY
jgi:hypothetical protein